MNKEKFTELLLWNMYELGYKKAEVEDGVIFFFEKERELLNPFLPRVDVECTTIDNKDRRFDVGYLLGIVDWSKVAIDTPILVKDDCDDKWEKAYFARYEDEMIYAWNNGRTSFSARNKDDTYIWDCAKIADKGGV